MAATISSWASEIGYYDEVNRSRIKLLEYGEPGVGKTLLASTFPGAFFIDSDDGGATLRKLHMPFLPVTFRKRNYDKIEDFIRRLRLNKGKVELPNGDVLDVKTVVFDSVMSLADALMAEFMLFPKGSGSARDPLTEKPVYDHWQMLQMAFKTLFKSFNDLEINLVGTAGVKLERDEALGTFVGKPNIQGGYRDIIGHEFDEWYYLATEGSGDSVKYYAYTKRYSHYQCKSRNDLPPKIQNPTYGKLYEGVK